MANQGRRRTRGDRRRAANQARSQQKGWLSRIPPPLLWGGLGVAVVAILAVVAVVNSPGAAPGGAPDFHMVAFQGQETLGGNELDFSELFRPGQTKPVVLNFWAGLCPPCRAEMPGFQRVYENQGDQFIMVGVDIGPFTGLGSNADARRLLDELNVTYPAAYATDDPTRAYQVQGMPTTVFLTPDGSIFSKRTGFLPEGELRSRLQDLLAASS